MKQSTNKSQIVYIELKGKVRGLYDIGKESESRLEQGAGKLSCEFNFNGSCVFLKICTEVLNP